MDSPGQVEDGERVPSGGEPSQPAREERRDSALRLLSRLAGGLAHEIKNPLSTMAINLALLQEEWERAAQARNPSSPEPTPREQRSLKRIRTLQREVERLEQVLEQFLHFAKGGEIDRKPEDIGRIVRELLEFVEPENAQAGIRAHTDLAVGLPLVLADEAQVKQALLNILINARQAMPDGGELLVRVRRAGKDVEITITDTGIGMTPEQIERCFEPYWSDKQGGTGLGLSTSRRIVEEHGGSIQVLSERGRGTAFTIFLPLAVEIARAPGAAERVKPAARRAANGKGRT
jgi:signal transduction histidine kinase